MRSVSWCPGIERVDYGDETVLFSWAANCRGARRSDCMEPGEENWRACDDDDPRCGRASVAAANGLEPVPVRNAVWVATGNVTELGTGPLGTGRADASLAGSDREASRGGGRLPSAIRLTPG